MFGMRFAQNQFCKDRAPLLKRDPFRINISRGLAKAEARVVFGRDVNNVSHFQIGEVDNG